jgi:membrane-associated phospholipid phosphatase
MRRLGLRACGIAVVVMMGASWPVRAQEADERDRRAEDVVAADESVPPAPVFELAQVVGQPAGPPPTPRHTGVRALFKDLGSDVRHLPSKENLFWVGVGGGLALIAHPFDDNANRAMVGSTLAENIFKPGRVLGQFGTLIGAAAITYTVGRMKDEPKVSHVGMDLLEAIAVSEGLAQSIKYSVRRQRPDLSGRTSFPSGHAADTFAFATALERHLGWRGAVPAYILSSYVAISRVPANRHWLSDAVFGASVGIIAGRTVTRHGRKFPFEVMTTPGGAMVAYVRRS